MDRRITLVFAAILILLGGYIWYTFLRADAPPTALSTPEPTAILFLSIESDQVQALEIFDVKNSQITRVSRAGENWNLEKPLQGQADGDRVNALLFELSRVDAERKLAPPSELAPFGLNPPLYQVVLTLKDDHAVTMQIGNQNSDGNYVYALKKDDSAVYLIDTSIGGTIQEFVTLPPYTPTPEPSESPETTPTP